MLRFICLNIITIILLFLLCATCYAADINIRIDQKSINDNITISVTNQSKHALQLAKIRLKLNQQIYWIAKPQQIQPQQTKNFVFKVKYPQIPGSYAQIVSVFYYNEGFLFSLSDVGYFNYQSPQQLIESAQLSNSNIDQHAVLTLSTKQPDLWTLITPDEVTSKKSSYEQSIQLLLTGKHSGFTSNYPIFAVKEVIINNLHYAKVLRSQVKIIHQNNSYQRGRTSNLILSVVCVFSLGVFLFLAITRVTNKEIHLILLLFTSRLFFLAIAYILLKNANHWFSFSTLLTEHFSGKNYRYFFLYFIDIYFWSFVLLYLPYLKYFELAFNSQNKTYVQALIQNDKYIAVLSWLFNFLIKRSSIGNVIHQWNLLQNFNWTFQQINAFILALLILTDTSIFLVGYMFENSQLGSKVRSVEPTILGWLVCLWCYPPFNTFSFTPFDINLINIHYPIAAWAEPIVLVLITLLWGIFTWASLNLGFKASNLTNRGIVNTGAYRYCRHPAYTAKILVWLIEAIFLGKYFIGLFIAFLIIYFLRAITEERHLSKDPDYQEYKKQVPYRFIPGLI